MCDKAKGYERSEVNVLDLGKYWALPELTHFRVILLLNYDRNAHFVQNKSQVADEIFSQQ
jgi:hypothetical protein